VGALAINGGAANTTSARVTLTISATDATGLAQMCLSATDVTGDACSPYVDYNSTVDWTLDATGGDGDRTVWLYLVDALGFKTDAITATIFLDLDTDGPTGAAPAGGPAGCLSPRCSASASSAALPSPEKDSDLLH
jgi:hypothetical protein